MREWCSSRRHPEELAPEVISCVGIFVRTEKALVTQYPAFMPDKYQKEIEEILKNAGEAAPDESVREAEKPLEDRPKAVRRASKTNNSKVSYRSSGGWPTITPGKILMTGLIVFIVTALLQIWVLIPV